MKWATCMSVVSPIPVARVILFPLAAAQGMLAVPFQRCRLSDEPRRSTPWWFSVESIVGQSLVPRVIRRLALVGAVLISVLLTGCAHAFPKQRGRKTLSCRLSPGRRPVCRGNRWLRWSQKHHEPNPVATSARQSREVRSLIPDIGNSH